MFPQTSTDSRSLGARLARLVSGVLLLLAGLAVVVYLAARFVLWPNIDTVVERYAGRVEERLGTSLTWKSIRPQWTGLRPSIEILGPVLGQGEQAVRADRLFGTISLRALLQGQADFHYLVLDNPVVPLVRSGDSLSLAAFDAGSKRARQSSGLAQWLLQQPDVRIGGGTLLIADAEDPRRNLRFDQVALVLRSHGEDHDARLDIASANALAASLVVQADLRRKPQSDPMHWQNWAGSLQLDGRQLSTQVLLAQLPSPARAAVQARLIGVVADSLAGQVDPSIFLELDHGKLSNARIRLRSDDLAMMLAAPAPAPGGKADGAARLRFTRINADLRVRQNADGATEVSAAVLELAEAAGMRIRATSPQPVLTLARDDGRIQRVAGGFERIDIAPTLGLAKLLVGDPGAGDVSDAVHRLSGSGQLRDVDFEWRRGAGEAPPPWRVRAAFDRTSLAMAPTEQQSKNPWMLRIPDIQHLSGSLEATGNGGKATLRTPASATADGPAAGRTAAPVAASGRPSAPASMIRFGGLLVEPEVPFSSLDAQFSWKVDRSAGADWLAVQVDRLVFANSDGGASVSGRYRTGGRGAGVIDLQARIGSLQANRVWRYLPHEVPESVRHWSRQALEAGALEGAEMRWRGDIKDFPYRARSPQDQGEFRVTGKIRDVLLKYAPDWPAIHGLSGEVGFDRASMKLQADRASLLEVALSGVNARMEDMADGKLEIDGRAHGDVAQMLKFVNTSPLVGMIGGVTRPMVAKGPASLELNLGLPLKDPRASTARGRLDLAGAMLEFEPAQTRLDDIKGGIEFTEKSLAFNGLRGTFSGAPIEVSGRTGEAGSMQLQARGTMTAEGLRQFAGAQLARHLRGATAYRVEADIGPHGTRMTIESDLAGLASDLPSPMAKAADAQWPFKLTMAPADGPQRSGASSDRIEASLGGEILLSVERSRSDARRPMQVIRAALAVNRQPALPDQGISFQFTGQRIDLDAWKQVLAPATGAADGGAEALGGDTAAALPLTVSLLADEVRIADRNLSKVVLGASRVGSQWLVNVSAREINGFLTWSGTAATPGKLTARLGRLEIPQSQQQEIAASLSTGPTSLPAMDITAERFILGGLDFGTLELVARNATAQSAPAAKAPAAQSSTAQPPAVQPAAAPQAAPQAGPGRGPSRPRVWLLERLRLATPEAELEAKGQWDQNTSLSYRLNISDAGGFLDRLQLKSVVKGGNGVLSGDMHWRGSPFSMDLPSLGGTVDIAVRNGQFLKVEPGAAKLIAVLNLQALPKLLTLDFRDIFAQGFSFDELRGTVKIEEGVASTDSLAMRGLQAVVQIKGQADLKASTQNLKVVVIPELNGGLATLAFAALVNPAIGLGAFLAQSLFSQPLSKALAYEIEITGSWSDPTVVERRRERFGPPAGQ